MRSCPNTRIHDIVRERSFPYSQSSESRSSDRRCTSTTQMAHSLLPSMSQELDTTIPVGVELYISEVHDESRRPPRGGHVPDLQYVHVAETTRAQGRRRGKSS